MSSVPLTFNNGYTTTAGQIVPVQDRGRKKGGADRNKTFLVTTLVKDGVDKNNRPLYKRNIYSFDSASKAKTFKNVVNQTGDPGDAKLIATGSTKDGQKTFEFTDAASDAQKNQEEQIKRATRKQVENIGREEGGEVRNHTTEFKNKKVGDNKDDSIDAKDTAKQEAEARSGIGRKSYTNMVYPIFIENSKQDKLRIKILKIRNQFSQGTSNRRDKFQAFKTRGEGVRLPYDIPKGKLFHRRRGQLVGYGEAEAFERAQDRIYAQGQNTKLLEFGLKQIGSVTLPVPNGVSDQNTVSFGQGTMNPAQKDLSNIALKTILEGVGSGGQEARKAFDKLVKDKNVQRAVAGFIGGTAVGIDPNELLSRTEGVVFNNNLALLFKSPTLRPFTFQFNLSPRGREEAVQVQKIIRAFKQSSAVQKTKGEIFLAAPNTYALEFIDGRTNNTHPFLPNIKQCALLNVSVNYMPENSYMTYEDSSMVSYSLSLSFQELAPIFNSDYDDLDVNKSGAFLGRGPLSLETLDADRGLSESDISAGAGGIGF